MKAGYSSEYCVCNKTFCDAIPTINVTTLKANVAVSFISSIDGLRFHREEISMREGTHVGIGRDKATVEIKTAERQQSILGFGGAFTDAAGIQLESLSNVTKALLIQSYFGPDGLEYSLARVPIGSTDFSTRCYSYAETKDDFDLKSFKLTEEDLNLKIPYLLWASSLSRRPLRLFGSPWSPPNWMKSNGDCAGYGRIKGDPASQGPEGKYYKAWAAYFVRFLEEYRNLGLEFWGVTAQNEPTDGYIPFFSFNCLGFTAEEQRDFIKFHLGPALTAFNSFNFSSSINLMILDDNRVRAWKWVNTVLSDPEAANYVNGTAIHWYWNSISSPLVTTDLHNVFPSKFILATEACDGWMPFEHQVWLGDWSRAEDYATSIIEDLNNWVVGWTDWNLALDMQGGPNWAENFVDAPIIVNKERDEFYRQPMFYILGHFSKFLPPESIVIKTKVERAFNMQALAAVWQEEGVDVLVLVLHNKSYWPQSVIVTLDVNHKRTYETLMPPKSIRTILIRR